LLILDWPGEAGAIMDETELRDRTKAFALRAMKLVAALPGTVVGRNIGGQLTRSATSIGANYRAVCRARSRADFIAKLGIVVEEVDESAYWLELVIEGGLVKPALVQPLLDEACQLTRIMIASKKTAQENKSKISNQKSRMV
jgi:four helix bundle protein